MYIGDQKNTRVCQCGDCLNIMERIKITSESQKKKKKEIQIQILGHRLMELA